MMTPLERRLRRMIETGGPISVSSYMALCLADPQDGYYTNRTVFGAQGDFITAPEISQLFGEMVGVCLSLALDALGRPATLVEFGAGRGTLMRDVLRTLARLRPGHRLDVALVEMSPRLREIQRAALAGLAEPRFCATIDDLPADRPLLIIGNEFFDALPVRQFVKHNGAWRERMVGVSADAFAFTPGDGVLAPQDLPTGADAAPEGALFEIAPAREAVMSGLAERLARQSGFGLFFDYGHLESGFGDTLQAVRNHAYAPVLEAPGHADITSHVDFQALRAAAERESCRTAAMTQGAFLLGLGLLERAGLLGAGKDAVAQDAIAEAVERLAAPARMGGLFKVLAIASGMAMPAPFSAEG